MLRTRDHVKPVFVSVGHDIDLDTAKNITLDCARGFRLPEPTRLAYHLVTYARKKKVENPDVSDISPANGH